MPSSGWSRSYESLQACDSDEQVRGLRIAHRYVACPYDAETGEHGERVTEVDIADIQFGRKWRDTLFAPPEGAHVIDDIDEVEP